MPVKPSTSTRKSTPTLDDLIAQEKAAHAAVLARIREDRLKAEAARQQAWISAGKAADKAGLFGVANADLPGLLLWLADMFRGGIEALSLDLDTPAPHAPDEEVA